MPEEVQDQLGASAASTKPPPWRGSFYIELSQLKENFNFIKLCQVEDSYQFSSISFPINAKEGHSASLEIVEFLVREPGEFTFSLSQTCKMIVKHFFKQLQGKPPNYAKSRLVLLKLGSPGYNKVHFVQGTQGKN